ncbi:MAG: hypothetical protein ACYDHF_04000 [Candidatus Cryosericum sp.]
MKTTKSRSRSVTATFLSILLAVVLAATGCASKVVPAEEPQQQEPAYVADLVRQLTPSGITVQWNQPVISPDPPTTRVEYQVTQRDYPKAWLQQEIDVPDGISIVCMNGTGWVLGQYIKKPSKVLAGYSLYRVENRSLYKVVDLGQSNSFVPNEISPIGDQTFVLSDRYCVWGSYMITPRGNRTVTLWAYDLVTKNLFQWGDSEQLPRPVGSGVDNDFLNDMYVHDDGTVYAVMVTTVLGSQHSFNVLLQSDLSIHEQVRVVASVQDVGWSVVMRDGNDLWVRQETQAVSTSQGSQPGSISLIRMDLSSGKKQTFITDGPLAVADADGKDILLIHEGSTASMSDRPVESPTDSPYADLWLFTASDNTLRVVARIPWNEEICGPCSARLLASGIVYDAQGPQHLFFSFRERKFYNIDRLAVPAFRDLTRVGIFKYGLDAYWGQHDPSEPKGTTTVQILEPD